MIYNEYGTVITTTKKKRFVSIGEEQIDMLMFEQVLLEDKILDDPKLKSLLDDISKDIEECDNSEIVKKKDVGKFMAEKTRHLIGKLSLAISIGALGGGMVGYFTDGMKGLIIMGISLLFNLASVIVDIVVINKPTKERNLLGVADDVVRWYDEKIVNNDSISESEKEKLMEKARKLMVKVNKARQAINLRNKRWYETFEWGISSDIRFQKKFCYFTEDISNQKYEENKEAWDKAVRKADSMWPKIIKDVAKQIKRDCSTSNPNIQNLSENDIVNALEIYSSCMAIDGSRITIAALTVEKDAINRSLTGIPTVLGRVIKIEIYVTSSGNVTWQYFILNIPSYS